jgi:hypothetical protein
LTSGDIVGGIAEGAFPASAPFSFCDRLAVNYARDHYWL